MRNERRTLGSDGGAQKPSRESGERRWAPTILTETIGCDLGDKRSEVCVLDADGEVKDRATIRTTRRDMTLFFTRERAHVVIEVGAHSRWVRTLLKALGHRVTVANPRRVKLISASNNKTDRHDAEL